MIRAPLLLNAETLMPSVCPSIGGIRLGALPAVCRYAVPPEERTNILLFSRSSLAEWRRGARPRAGRVIE